MRAIIIPARSGSKRIPGKNIANFLGKPMLQYSIQTAIDSNLYHNIIVSTDDKNAAGLATDLGVYTLPDRPKSISGDVTPITDVVKYEIGKHNLQKYSSVTLLFACAPLVEPIDLILATEKFEKQDSCSSLMAVAEYPAPTEWALSIESDEIIFNNPELLEFSSSALIPKYYDAGQFYMYQPMKLLDSRTHLITKGIMPFIVQKVKAVDIDDPADWELAERLYFAQHQFKR